MRILSDQIKDHAGSSVHIEGWLHKKRLLGALNFLVIRDRRGIVQVVVDDKAEAAKLQGLYQGTVLAIDGQVVKEDRAPGGAELHQAKLAVLVPVKDEPLIEIDKPLSHKPDNLDTLFDFRVLGLRNLNEQAIFKIRSYLLRYIREYLYKEDFVEINSPKLVAGAAEGGAEVFKFDYFGKEATLAQSPQLYKQIMVGVFERVFEIGPAFRAELSATTRHVSEVTMLDVEMGFINGHEDILKLLEQLLFSVLTKLYQENQAELGLLKAPQLKLTESFPRYSMKQIHELYSKEKSVDTTKETDLIPDEEKWICQYALDKDGSEAVYATDLPASKMKFYHMKGDGEVARSADLLFRGVEIATVPQREHRPEVLIEQIRAAGIDPESAGFKDYMMAFKFGLPAHGGFGFGIDRLTERVVGLSNVKEAILFPRDINRLTP